MRLRIVKSRRYDDSYSGKRSDASEMRMVRKKSPLNTDRYSTAIDGYRNPSRR